MQLGYMRFETLIECFQNHFDNKINKTEIYPNWAVIVFIVRLVLGVSNIVYFTMSYFLLV